MKWHGDRMSTDVKINKTNMDQCYAPNVTNPSPTPTSLEVGNTAQNYAHPVIIAHSNCYMNNWKNTMEGDGR